MPLEDDVLPAEEQRLPSVVSPTTDSPSYITEFDPEEDLKEDDKDPEEDPVDYPNDKDADDEDEDEEEEHLAPSHHPYVIPLPGCLSGIKHLFHSRLGQRLTYFSPYPLCHHHHLHHTHHHYHRYHLHHYQYHHHYLYHLHHYLLVILIVLEYRAAMIRLRVESPSTSYPLPLPSPIVLPHTRAFVAMMRVVAPSTYILASRSETPPSRTPPSRTPPLLLIPLPIPSSHLLLPSTDYRAGVSEVT
ncbi:hypothetical protein Tco_0166416 [Tanacetum coccineum]